jgi:hypothetical protein
MANLYQREGKRKKAREMASKARALEGQEAPPHS